ncbi:MAG: hypothetical protein GY773_00935 [Actinomycetia bacterium]|nr:hypothetical protein [Actinomycetes bacterium]
MPTHKRPIPFQVSWIVDKMHISTPFDTVLGDIARRLDSNNVPPVDPDALIVYRRERATVLTLAAIRHRQNRADYRWVMGPH